MEKINGFDPLNITFGKPPAPTFGIAEPSTLKKLRECWELLDENLQEFLKEEKVFELKTVEQASRFAKFCVWFKHLKKLERGVFQHPPGSEERKKWESWEKDAERSLTLSLKELIPRFVKEKSTMALMKDLDYGFHKEKWEKSGLYHRLQPGLPEYKYPGAPNPNS